MNYEMKKNTINPSLLSISFMKPKEKIKSPSLLKEKYYQDKLYYLSFENNNKPKP
jgi:hypothetical protein